MADPGTFLYFAYGSNLLTERIRIQNPSAVSLGAAKLEHYKLEFRRYSQRWKGHSATINESQGSHVWGVLWQLHNKHLETLNNQEGVHDQIYKQIKVQVEWNGKLVDVNSYQLLTDRLDTDLDNCKPSKVYKNVIVKGAKENKLPSDYLEKLISIEDNGYDGPVKVKLDLD